MIKIASIVGLALVAVGGAMAGTLTPINLTTAYVGTATCTAPCTLSPGPTSVASVTQGTYLNTTFTASTGTNYPTGPTISSSPQTTTAAPFIIAAQSGGNDTFLSASTSGLGTEVLVDLGSCSTTSLTGACGLMNVDNVYTMIQEDGPSYGLQGVTLQFNGQTSGGTALTYTVDLTAGVDYRSNNSSFAANCTDANSNNPTKNVSTGCTAATNPNLAQSATDTNPGGTATGAQVVTYNNAVAAETSTLTYYLDVQEIELGTLFQGGSYLDSVEIINNSPSASKARVQFSGLTVDQASPTPEPGTIALLGLGLFGLFSLRKIFGKRAAAFSALGTRR